jgi:hypothetical protein
MKFGEVLRPGNVQPWEKVRDQLHRILRGWAAYFSQGTRLMAYRAVDHHVYTRVPSHVLWGGPLRLESRPGASADGVAPPRFPAPLSNRTYPFRASGFPTDFTSNSRQR